ncbi:hypothetical protein SAMN04488058_11463 [Deinococcus reticulitermitis]|uniref:Uncharacterized protein n=1 Tax=Deinococcus reticulitermitis TaxID=856736 RepID=A0A1H7ATD6_9DEIO|nr:hypothetical protein SAMN04488058_11463 [Deinococcus reticulitermitis]
MCGGVLTSALLARRAGRGGGALLPALALLLAMPRTKPGRAGHWRLALLVSAAFAWGARRVW